MQTRTGDVGEGSRRGEGGKVSRPRRGEAEWKRTVVAQQQSGLSVVEFCRQRRMAESTFRYWSWRLARDAKAAVVTLPGPRFLAVPLTAAAAEEIAAPIEVELGTLRVRLDGAAAARVVDAIVARLSGGVLP